MSPKTTSYSSTAEYLTRKQLENEMYLRQARDLADSIQLHNMIGVYPDDIKAITEAFLENTEYAKERSNGIRFFHDVLSFHEKDAQYLSDNPEVLMDLAQKYLELRAPNSLAMAALHTDTPRPHFHFLISGNQIQSELSSSVRKKEFTHIKDVMNRYQRRFYPELKHTYKGKELIPEKEIDHGLETSPKPPTNEPKIEIALLNEKPDIKPIQFDPEPESSKIQFDPQPESPLVQFNPVAESTSSDFFSEPITPKEETEPDLSLSIPLDDLDVQSEKHSTLSEDGELIKQVSGMGHNPRPSPQRKPTHTFDLDD